MVAYVVRPAAAGDIRRAYRWYERTQAGLGHEFLAEVRNSIGAALATPDAYPILHRQTRRVLVHRFPYGLYYRVVDGVIVFVACTHTHREPASWQRRR